MKDLAIAIEVGSPNSKTWLIRNTFESIRKNIGDCDWKVFICLGLNIPNEVDEFVRGYVNQYPDRFEIFLNAEVYWSEFINSAIDYSAEYKYFVKSHDDIELITPGFFNKTMEALKQIGKETGWISFHDIGWERGDFSPSTRDGYYIDVMEENSWNTRQIFQFHLFPQNWTRASKLFHYTYYGLRKITSLLKIKDLPYPKPVHKIKKYKLDLPSKPVKCHAPFNHFVMIERTVLEKIGKCDNWNTFNALYVDEDWGLRCLEKNIPNVWIPNIEYFHYRGKYEGGGTRSWKTITKEAKRVEELFFRKWGFHPMPSRDELEIIRKKHNNNLIPWSGYRRSWDWEEA